jgi:hypothetical protein
LLTPAELIAASQVALTGAQSLRIGAGGNAVGGRFSLTGSLAHSVGSLVVPQNVKLFENFANLPTLNLSGNLTDAGKIIAFSTNSQVVSAAIDANNIYVQAGGLITSFLPVGHAPAGAVSTLHLNLNALGDIVNSGSIVSFGNLSLNAGGSITNGSSSVGAQHAVPAPAVIQAASDVNLSAGSGNITNGGVINALNGNVNFNAGSASDLTINNQNGTVQALTGAINVRNSSYNGSANVNLNGGNWLSQELNLNSGQGTVTANVEQATGTVNVNAGQVHLSASTNNLMLGNMNISGDPTFYNNAGSVTLNSALDFSGQDLAIVASQDIYTTGSASIDTSSSTGNGGNIILIAGAGNAFGGPFVVSSGSGSSDNSTDSTTTITIQGPSKSGGAIDLTQGGGITSFTSQSTVGNGGNITLIAFYGSGSGSPLGLMPGTINLPTSVTVNASGGGTSTNGNVLMIAGAGQSLIPTPVSAINIGTIASVDTGGGGGSVRLAAATPTLTGVNGYISILNGSILQPSDSFTWGNVFEGSVSFNTIGANQVQVVAGGNITIGGSIGFANSVQLTTYGTGTIAGGGTIHGGSVTLQVGQTPVTLTESLNDLVVTQGTSVVNIDLLDNLSQVSIAAAGNITVANAVNATNASLSLDTTFQNPYSNSIVLNGSLTANGGITLIVGGTGVIGGTAPIISTGEISLTYGVTPLTLGLFSEELTVTASGVSGPTTLIIGMPANSLDYFSLASASNIAVPVAIDFGSTSFTMTTQGSATIGGSGSISTTGSVNLFLGNNNITLSNTGAGISVIQTGVNQSTALSLLAVPLSLAVYTVGGNIGTIGSLNLGAGDLELSTQGTGTITGTVAAGGTIALYYGTPAVALGMTSGNVTVSQGANVLTIGTAPSSITALYITAQGDIDTASDITLGGVGSGTLGLTSTGGNLNINNNVTANGLISLSVGASGTIGGSGTINSTGYVSVNFASGAVTLGTAPGKLTISQTNPQTTITTTLTVEFPSQLAELTVSTAGDIDVGNNITIGELLTLSSLGGNINLSNNITASGGITLKVTGSNVIAGPATVMSNGQLTVNAGTSGTSTINTQVASVTGNTNGASIVVLQTGDIQLNSSNLGSGSLAIDVTANSNIEIEGVNTANGGLQLTTSGTGAISGHGTLISTGAVQLSSANSAAVTINQTANNITVSQQNNTLTIGTSTAMPSSLSITSGGDIDTTSNISIGGTTNGSLLLTSTGGNVNVNNGITANGEVSLAGQVVGGSGSVASAGPISMQVLGSSLVTLGVASTGPFAGDIIVGQTPAGQGTTTLTIAMNRTEISELNVVAGGNITTSSDISIGSASSGILSLSSAGNTGIVLLNNIAANGAVRLQAVNGTVADVGTVTVNSSGTISLVLGSTTTTLSVPLSNLTVTQGSSVLNIGTALGFIGSLQVNTAGDIVVASPINMGGGSLSLATTNGNISVSSNDLIANGGITLAASGTIGGTTGTLASTNSISLSPGGAVTLSSGVTVSETINSTTASISLGSTPTLFTVNSTAGITVSAPLALGETTTSVFSLNTSTGNISLNADISAYNIVLFAPGTVEAPGTIGGNGVVHTVGSVTITIGSAVTLGEAGSSFSLVQPGVQLNVGSNVGSPVFQMSLLSPSVTIDNGTSITAPAFFVIHTNNFSDSGVIASSISGGVMQIDNNGLSGSLTLSGNGTPSSPTQILNNSSGGGYINIFDYNGQQINITSSYDLNAGGVAPGGGLVRIWEVVPNNSYPPINASISYSGVIVNPNSGQIVLGGSQTGQNVTLILDSPANFVGLAAWTVVINSASILQTTMSPFLYVHTNKLVDNGTITSSVSGGTAIQIDDQGMNPRLPLMLLGSPQPITDSSASGGAISIIDYNGQQIDVNGSYTIDAGANCPYVSGIFEESLGGQATGGARSSLVSTPMSGSIVLAPGVTLTLTCKAELELSAPTQIYNNGSQIIVTQACNQLILDVNNLVNNGTVNNEVSGSVIRLGDDNIADNSATSPTVAYVQGPDIQGPVSISGKGSIGFNGIAGNIVVTTAVEGTSSPSSFPGLMDPITFTGIQTININTGSAVSIHSYNNVAFSGNFNVQGGGFLFIESPKVTNNGTIAAVGEIEFFNALADNSFLVVSNNGLVSSSAGDINVGTSPSPLNPVGASSVTVGGAGGAYSVSGGSDPQMNVYADPRGVASNSITVVGTIAISAGRLAISTNNLVNNGTISSSVSGEQIAVINSSGYSGPINMSGVSGNIDFTNGASGTVVVSDSNSAGVIITGQLIMNGGTGTGSSADIETGAQVEVGNGAVLSLTGLNTSFDASIVPETPGDNSTVLLNTQTPAFYSTRTFQATVNVGQGTFGITSINNSPITVLGTTGTFNITSSFMKLITAGTMEIGSPTSSDGITLAGSFAEPTTGSVGMTPGYFGFDFENGGAGGSYTGGTGHTISLQGQSLKIDVAGVLNSGTGAISGTTGNVTMSGGALTVAGAIKLTGAGQIQLTGGPTSMAINAAVSTLGAVSVSQLAGTFSQSTSGVITANAVSVNFGAVNTMLTTAANSLTVASLGNVTLKNTGKTSTLLNASTITDTFSLTNSVPVTIGGTVSASSVTLTCPGLILNGSVVSSANGSITYSGGTGGGIADPVGSSVVLQAANISLTGGNMGISGTPVYIDTSSTSSTPTLTLSSTSGSVFLSDSNSVSINKSTVKSLQLTDTSINGVITVAQQLSGTTLALSAATGSDGSITLNANVGGTGAAITLTTDGTGLFTQSSAADAITGSSLTLINANGSFGTSPTTAIKTSVTTLNANCSNLYVTSATAMSLGSTTTSVSVANIMQVTDTAAVTAAGTVTAGSLSITAGSLAIKSSLGSPTGTTSLTTTGSGAMTWAVGGLVNGTSVTFTDGTGAIGGSGTASIKTSTALLTVASSGAVYLNNSQAVTVQSASAGSVFSLTNSGNLTAFGTITAGGTAAGTITLKTLGGSSDNIVLDSGGNIGLNNSVVTLSSDIGSISTLGGIVHGATVSLITGGGSIGAGSNAPVTTSAANLTITAGGTGSGNVFVDATNATVKLNASTGGNSVSGSFDLTLGTGVTTLTVGGVLSSSNLDLGEASGSNANIILSANVGAAGGTTTISAAGAGNITQTAGLVLGANITLGSTTSNGFIGTSTKSVATAASSKLTLDTSTSGTGNVYDANNQNVTLDNSQAGGNFTVASTGGLSVNSVTTGAGSITLSSNGGVLTVNGGTNQILATSGNITLQNSNTTTGIINIENGAKIYTQGTVAGSEAIYIYIGTKPTTLVQGTTPMNITPSFISPGQVYFGPATTSKNIHASGTNNLVNADGRNVVFSAGTAAASTITLNGDVTITADLLVGIPISFDPNRSLQSHDEVIVDTGEFDDDDQDNTVAQVR